MRVLVILAAGAALLGSAGVAQGKTLTSKAGDTAATITWTMKNDYEARNVRITIVRAGETAYDQPILARNGQGTPDIPQSIRVVDLERDGQQDVIADLYTGGAHCCSYSLVYHWDSGRNDYVVVRHDWGDLGYVLRNLGGSAGPEFVSADDRFAYAFTSYAGSEFPVQVWHYGTTGFEDVTRRFPALVRKDATHLWKSYRKNLRSQFPDVRGILAAWAADEAMLGKSTAAFKRLEGLEQRGILNGDPPWLSGQRYLGKLRVFLRKTGYLEG